MVVKSSHIFLCILAFPQMTILLPQGWNKICPRMYIR